ncbi:hypothetical protein N9204_00345 [bacterium]|nr:hypothetical protein [bacterium]
MSMLKLLKQSVKIDGEISPVERAIIVTIRTVCLSAGIPIGAYFAQFQASVNAIGAEINDYRDPLVSLARGIGSLSDDKFAEFQTLTGLNFAEIGDQLTEADKRLVEGQ